MDNMLNQGILFPALFGIVLGLVVWFAAYRAIKRTDPANAMRNSAIIGVMVAVAMFVVRYYHVF